MGSGITYIGDHAFENCDEFYGDYSRSTESMRAGLVFPDSLEYIGDSAFQNCKKLKNVTFGTGIKHIGDSAFYDCDTFTHVTIPDNVEYIGFFAFCCDNLAEIRLGSGIKVVDQFAFTVTGNPDEETPHVCHVYVAETSKPALWHESWIIANESMHWGSR